MDYKQLWQRYVKLVYVAKMALRRLVRIEYETDSNKEQKALIEALKEVPDGIPTEAEDGSDT